MDLLVIDEKGWRWGQTEIIINFVVGAYDNDSIYVDKFSWVTRRYLLSLTGFWFDSITSIPWSCMDLQSYLVRFVALSVN